MDTSFNRDMRFIELTEHVFGHHNRKKYFLVHPSFAKELHLCLLDFNINSTTSASNTAPRNKDATDKYKALIYYSWFFKRGCCRCHEKSGCQWSSKKIPWPEKNPT